MPDREPAVDGLLPWAAVDRTTESLIPYAELMRDVVDRRLYPTPGTDLVAPSTDTLFDDAFRIVLERMITDRLHALTAEQFVTAYRSVLGDDAFARILRGQADLELADRARRLVLDRLQREARVHGRVLLPDLDADEVLTIGLFDPARPDLAALQYSDNQQVRPLHRVLQVRLVVPSTGAVEIRRDTWTGAHWSESLRGEPAEPLSTALLGTGPASSEAPSPALILHAPILLRASTWSITPAQIVGYVTTVDGAVLLDAP